MWGNVLTHSVDVGSALAAGPIAFGRRPVDKRRPYTRLHESGLQQLDRIADRHAAGLGFVDEVSAEHHGPVGVTAVAGQGA